MRTRAPFPRAADAWLSHARPRALRSWVCRDDSRRKYSLDPSCGQRNTSAASLCGCNVASCDANRQHVGAACGMRARLRARCRGRCCRCSARGRRRRRILWTHPAGGRRHVWSRRMHRHLVEGKSTCEPWELRRRSHAAHACGAPMRLRNRHPAPSPVRTRLCKHSCRTKHGRVLCSHKCQLGGSQVRATRLCRIDYRMYLRLHAFLRAYSCARTLARVLSCIGVARLQWRACQRDVQVWWHDEPYIRLATGKRYMCLLRVTFATTLPPFLFYFT